jgi:hypothetical protein
MLQIFSDIYGGISMINSQPIPSLAWKNDTWLNPVGDFQLIHQTTGLNFGQSGTNVL